MIIGMYIAIVNAAFFWLLLLFGPINKRLDFKPLNCSNCLAFWVTGILTYLMTGDILSSIISGQLSFFFVEVIRKKIMSNK